MVARSRDGLRRRMIAAGEDPAAMPLIRVVGHHCQVYGMLQSQIPDDPTDRIRVYVGEDGVRDDELVYSGVPLRTDWTANEITTCAALPVLRALEEDLARRVAQGLVRERETADAASRSRTGTRRHCFEADDGVTRPLDAAGAPATPGTKTAGGGRRG